MRLLVGLASSCFFVTAIKCGVVFRWSVEADPGNFKGEKGQTKKKKKKKTKKKKKKKKREGKEKSKQGRNQDHSDEHSPDERRGRKRERGAKRSGSQNGSKKESSVSFSDYVSHSDESGSEGSDASAEGQETRGCGAGQGWAPGRRGGSGQERKRGEVRTADTALGRSAAHAMANAERWTGGIEPINTVLMAEQATHPFTQKQNIMASSQVGGGIETVETDVSKPVAWLEKVGKSVAYLERMREVLEDVFQTGREDRKMNGMGGFECALTESQKRELEWDECDMLEGHAHSLSHAEEAQYHRLFKYFDYWSERGHAEGAVKALAVKVWTPMRKMCLKAGKIGGWNLAMYCCHGIRVKALGEGTDGLWDLKLLTRFGMVGITAEKVRCIVQQELAGIKAATNTAAKTAKQAKQEFDSANPSNGRFTANKHNWGVETRLQRGIQVPWLPLLREVSVMKDGTPVARANGQLHTGPTCKHCFDADRDFLHHAYQCDDKHPGWMTKKPWVAWLDQWKLDNPGK